ncbi:MAG: hypothetical protein JST28_24385 [Acidobacteria bacterium]|nr:hypothetical protein [Acidobacteriota bacterium]
MSSPRSWFRLPFVYRPRAERRESPALVAVHWDGHTPHQNPVANLSCSGAYLLTNENWNPGEIVSLTLQRRGALGVSTRNRFTVQVETARRDENGVGVKYLLPKDTDLRLWQPTIKTEVPQTEPEDIVREFRIAAAIAFIRRISPDATEHATWLLRRGLSSHRLEAALEVALHAEELLALPPRSADLSAHPQVVLHIIEHGSWPEVDWIQHYWSGLLASCCTSDRSAIAADLELPDLLSQLTTIQTRILAAACDSASKHIDSYGTTRANSLSRSADELTRISGVHDRAHIERDIQHLSWLGLLEQTVKWKFFSLIEEANITPTPLALKLYARCHAHRGELAAFYGLEPAVAMSFPAD